MQAPCQRPVRASTRKARGSCTLSVRLTADDRGRPRSLARWLASLPDVLVRMRITASRCGSARAQASSRRLEKTTPSVSAFVQHAVAVSLNDAAGRGALLASALDHTGGLLTRAERTWADDVLLKPSGKGRGKRARTRAA